MTLLKYLLIFILVFVLSCVSHDKKTSTDQKVSAKVPSDNSHSVTPLSQKDSITYSLNYSEWTLFWKNFQKAAAKKDTTTIVQLTYFPFIQNKELNTKDDFVQYYISQVYGLEKGTSPIISSREVFAQIYRQSNSEIPKFDSLHYTNFNSIDFYFARINGYYRLVEILTPG